ncbi:TIGR04283 family arsenosugar biosynthesis glycosyltransferase [Algoriphagus lutimaris]|uniref:TIGR04283 family arsenosugar biosynthesis glycosyltransferase n=1 Tax=Algoriphagus lutimaris TaxID=613197 RepID=UPI00196A5B52|nr:TIGR04283 family arsenosugar biosynthesis glycosyltransferase [Algoriphagus lutimaris]MBN3519161.1 TIGR04283 family arsenosugar biosynthesis glycosyltransferase [Algoriphagus lutimaris]
MIDEETISVIIPTYNEAGNLKELIPLIRREEDPKILEIIVVDAQSSDETQQVAENLGVKIFKSKRRSRAHQMNLGAKHAKGSIFYFVHADTRPFKGFAKDIYENYLRGKLAGCYRYSFDSTHISLKINAWFTRFNGIFAGGGDQTLYITSSLFEELEGFNEKYTIMEDFDLNRRIRKISGFHVIPKEVIVSARKYEENGWLRVQLANLAAFILFLLNSNPESIKSLYCTLLKQQKT